MTTLLDQAKGIMKMGSDHGKLLPIRVQNCASKVKKRLDFVPIHI
jgi:hypothetical protein